MKIKKVKKNTFCIDTGMTYIPFYKINDEEIILLDSGWAEEETEGIDKLLEKNNFKIVGIVCSHAHIDHIGNVAYFKNKYNCTIAMAAHVALICSSPVNLKVYYNNHTLSDVTEQFGHMVCKTDLMIWDNQDSVDMYNVKFKIVHTPGHSPGHICIVTPDDVAYVGDSLISYEVMEKSKLPYVFILQEDLKNKKELYDLNCSEYIVAHKGIYSNNIITKLISDNIDFYKNIAARVYDAINSTMTIENIIKTLLKKWNITTKSTHKYNLMERIIKAYVEYLNERGLMELIMEDGFLKYRKINFKDS